MNWQKKKRLIANFLVSIVEKNTSESLLTGILKRAKLLEINFLYTPVKFSAGGSMLRFSCGFQLTLDLTSS